MAAEMAVTQHGTVGALAAELIKAVEVIMHPMTGAQARMEASMVCDRFKEESPLCAQVGLYLASGTPIHFSQHVRHFGLQLMEHTIKFKWNCITQEEKVFIKDNAMQMLNLGVGSATDKSLLHLKDALSRIIVEMIKREWPQQWSELLPELSLACNKGETQTELVLLVFLRLVEDVAQLHTIESIQRRNDIYQALNDNVADIFEFFLRLVEQHMNAFREITAQGNFQQANAHSRVVEMVLLTLTGFVQWVSIQHIIANNGKLLHFLCILLNDKAFQYDAVECFAKITNRKGSIKELKPLLMLYEEQPLHYIYTACQLQPDTTSAQSVEQHYNFLKKLLLLLDGLAQLLLLLWGKEDALMERTNRLEIMLECLLSLVQHPSLFIANGATQIWQMLLKHDACSKDFAMANYIPKLIQSIAPRIVKITYPTMRCLPTSNTTAAYICMEYDSEEEFSIFFLLCRKEFLEIFRQATLVQPLVTFGYCEEWLLLRLRSASTECGNVECSVQDPIYLEWDALFNVIDCVLSRIQLVSERPSVQSVLHLLQQCLQLETNNPLIYSILLSCIKVLFVFLSMTYQTNNCVSLLPHVLEKIFTALSFKSPNDVEKVQQKAAKNLRKYAALLLVILAHKCPLLLLPVFEQINTHVKCLLQESLTPQPLCCQVRNILREALILISNHFCDYERQTVFIEHIIQEQGTVWLSFSDAFRSSQDFMHFVGLDKPAVIPIENDTAANNRARILDAIYVVIGVIKRCKWPDEPVRAQRGGFVVGCNELGNPICRNPATKLVVPLLSHILALVRILNELFKPEALTLLFDGYRNIYDLLEQDTKLLIGICAIPVDPLNPALKSAQNPFDKMKSFIRMLHEGCYHLMGLAGPSLGHDLYQLNGLADALINSVFSCLDVIPDYRLNPIVRFFLKPFVNSCPSAYYDSVLLPIFAHLAPLMCERLTRRWLYISSLYESGQLNGDNNDTKEVLEDQLNRMLTRGYLDVLKIVLVSGDAHGVGTDGNVNVTMEHAEHSMDRAPRSRAAQSALLSDIVSDLGAKLLRHSMISNYMLMTLLSAIAWNDGTCNMRAGYIAAPVMRFLVAEQLMDANKAVSAFTAVLQGLQVHGQHENNQSLLNTLGVQFYELLRPKFPILNELLHRIPNVNIADIENFDEKIAIAPVMKGGKKVERAKKDIFKKLTAQLVGPSVNQLFRHEVQIVNLPPLKTYKLKAAMDAGDDMLDQNSNLTTLFHSDK